MRVSRVYVESPLATGERATLAGDAANHIARVLRVLASIHLDNETAFAADQINCVRTDRLLSDELVDVEAARPESIPESGLRFRGSSSQASSALGFDLIGSSHVETPPHPDCFAIRPLPARGERLAPRANL